MAKKKYHHPKSGKKTPAHARLSLSMIVKDEEEFIGDCLKSVKGLVDEMVVVDTGSWDGTVSIAETLGACVYHFPWTDDFAAARNHALAQCRGEWVLALDADERLAKRDKHLIRSAVAKAGVDAWYLRFINMIEGKPSGGEVRLLRLFRKTPGTHYVGRVHEQPIQDIPKAVAGYCAATIRHYGYRASVLEQKQKLGRNVRLLELGLQDTEDGGDPMLRSSYMHYWALNAWGPERLRRLEQFARYVDAEFDHLKERMAWVPSGLVHYAVCLRDHGRHKEAADAARKILDRFGEAPLLHALIAGGHAAADEFEQAQKELGIAMAPDPVVSERHREYVMPPEVAPRLSKLILAEIHERQGQWPGAEKLYRELVQEIEDVRPRLVYAQIMQEKYQAALDTLNQGPKPLDEISPDLSCLAFILALIVQSGPGLIWWGEKVRQASASHAPSASVLQRVEQWEIGKPFTPGAFPELPRLIHVPVPSHGRAES